MKIATTTEDFLFYLDSDVERIRELHKAGFRYIDLSMYNFSPDSPYMQENWREEVQKIKAVADELGMQFVQAHSQGGRPMSEDKEHVDFLIKATQSCDGAGRAGADGVVVPAYAVALAHKLTTMRHAAECAGKTAYLLRLYSTPHSTNGGHIVFNIVHTWDANIRRVHNNGIHAIIRHH